MRAILLALSLTVALVGNAEAARKKVRVHKRAVIPEFSAKSYVVADANGRILKEHGINVILPIASLSKLMVGLLAAEQDLDEELVVPSVRNVHTSIPGKIKTLSRKELLTLALVRSDNFAAQILCSNLDQCVEKMNARAQALEMNHTTYVEPTGLDSENVSTAGDLLKLILVASQNPFVTELSSMPAAEIKSEGTTIKVKNTNPLTKKLDIILSKTGYTNPAGGCLMMMINTEFGQRILILLGSRNARTRIPDMERLVNGLN